MADTGARWFSGTILEQIQEWVCDQHTELFLNSTVHIGREKNSLGAYRAYWQEHRSSSSSLLSNGPASKWRLAHICGTAAEKDRRTCQQGPADRRLAVRVGWQVAAGWTSASRAVNYMVLGWWFGGGAQPGEKVLLLLLAKSNAPAVAHQCRRWRDGKASGLSSCPSVAFSAQSLKTKIAGPKSWSPLCYLPLVLLRNSGTCAWEKLSKHFREGGHRPAFLWSRACHGYRFCLLYHFCQSGLPGNDILRLALL